MATAKNETVTEMPAEEPEWWEGLGERRMTYAEEEYWEPSGFRPGKTQVHIAKRLNEHGIPCVFWGPAVQDIYGSNSGSADIQNLWVIPDRWFKAALKCLKSYPYLEPCTRGPGCHFRLAYFTPRMDAHFHSTKDCCYLTGLYRQSTVLASCRPIPTYLARLHDQGPHTIRVPDDYILASDPSLQKIKGPPGPDDLRENPCALSPDAHPMLIPAPHRLVESYLSLHAKYGTDETYGNLETLLEADERSEKGLDLGRIAPSVLEEWLKFKENYLPSVEPPPRSQWCDPSIEPELTCYCGRPDCYQLKSEDDLYEAFDRWGRLGIRSGVEGGQDQDDS